MERKTYLSSYQLALDPTGSPVELRRSATGIIYKGEDIVSGQNVAIELVRAATLRPHVREQLEKEAHVAKQIDHINIPVLHAFGFEGDEMVYVSEFFEGTTAEDWVKSHGPLPTGTVLRVALQAVSALGATTFHGIMHFAINPRNVMLVPGQTPQGDWPLIKILNFVGLAPAMESTGPAAADPAAPGGFVSPEQLRDGTVDFRSEIYSLGRTLWYLLTGTVPIAGAATVENANGMAGPVKRLLTQMLAVDPGERPLDPLALLQQIQDCISHLERLQSVASKFGLAAPSSTTPTQAVVPAAAPAPVVRRRTFPAKPLALAALLLALSVLAAVMLPDWLHSQRDIAGYEDEPIGVPIGVPDSAPATSLANNRTTVLPPSAPPAAVAEATAQPVVTENAVPAPSLPEVTDASLVARGEDDSAVAAESTPGEEPGGAAAPMTDDSVENSANPPVLVSIIEPGPNEEKGADIKLQQNAEQPAEVTNSANPPVFVSTTERSPNVETETDTKLQQNAEQPAEVAAATSDVEPAPPGIEQEHREGIAGNVPSQPAAEEPAPPEEGPMDVANSAEDLPSPPAAAEPASREESSREVASLVETVPNQPAVAEPARPEETPMELASSVENVPSQPAPADPPPPEEGPMEVAIAAPSTTTYPAVQHEDAPAVSEAPAEDQSPPAVTTGEGSSFDDWVAEPTKPSRPRVSESRSRKVAKAKTKSKEKIAATKRADSPKKPAVASSDNAGTIGRGVVRAQFIGTTPDGNLIFGLPSSQRGYVAAPASDRDSSRRRNRRAAEPRQELPVLPALPPDQ